MRCRPPLALPAVLLLVAASLACGAEGPATDAESSDLELTSGVHLAGSQPFNTRAVPYHGGPVIHRPQMINLYWGSYFATATGRKETALFDTFNRHAGGNSWFNIVTQYGDADGKIVNGSVAGPSLLVASDPPAKLTDTAMRHFLNAQLEAGAVPWNPSAIYFVFTPPGTSVELGKVDSCSDFCGYHEHYKATLTKLGAVQIIYAAIPHLDCPSACGTGSLNVNGPTLDAETSAMSHELLEAATDPLFDGWEAMKANDEVGDRCETAAENFTASWGGQKLAIQQIWSNQSSSCVNGM